VDARGGAQRDRCRTQAATQAPSTGHTRASTKAGVAALFTSHLVFASRGYGVGRAGAGGTDPVAAWIYRVIRRPALAEIVGDGRPWTVLMISLLSMPCR
jgi:hypothetical protein